MLLDFSKAFDKVSHEKLALKPHDYGIRGPALNDNRHQSVIVNGSSSEPIPVSSGVPHGCVVGPLFFIIYISDLHMNVKSKVRLFEDDTSLYLTISTSSQSGILQKDIDNLERCSHKCDMECIPFNAKSFTQQGPKPQFLQGILFTIAYWNLYLQQISWCRHLFRPIMAYTHKSHF